MTTYTEKLPYITDSAYEADLWNMLRGKTTARTDALNKGVDSDTGAFVLTPGIQNKFNTRLVREGLFRSIASTVHAYDNQFHIKTANNQDVATWVPEGAAIPMATGREDFEELILKSHKLATFFKLEEDFVQDNTFLLEDHLVKRLAKNFGRAEDEAFINGTGKHMPTGILADTGGADVGVTTDILTYDDEEVGDSKEIYVKKVKRYFDETPGKTTAAELVRAVFEASVDESLGDKKNPTVVLGYVKPGGKIILFSGDLTQIDVELEITDKLIMFSSH